ncbi:MAG: response regulator [Acidobacteriota bacterium]
MPDTTRVLVVEDEQKIADLLVLYFTREGYECHWLQDHSRLGHEVKQGNADLVLLDLNLPNGDGLALCREVRSFSEVPIIMITARVEEVDRLIGLDAGADDYVCKPFSPREVVARAKAILRRVEVQPRREARAVLEMNKQRHLISFKSAEVTLTPSEFNLLYALAESPGVLLARDVLLDAMYSETRHVTDRTVDTHLKNLRRKLEAVGAPTDLIASAYKLGYRLDLASAEISLLQ